MGTDPTYPCADTVTPNDEAMDKMPADLNDDRRVNVTDRSLTVLAIKAYSRHGTYNARNDLDASGAMNVTDRTIVTLYIKATGSQPCA